MFTLLTTRWRQITTFILFKNCHSKSSRDYGSQVAARYAPMNPRVVKSVVTQLQGGLYGKCLRTVVSVSNYTEEVESEYTEYQGANLRKSTLQQITRNG